MAWNPSLEVAAARDFGKKFGKQQVVIVGLDRKAGTLQTVSYGETKALCDQAATLAGLIHAAVVEAAK